MRLDRAMRKAILIPLLLLVACGAPENRGSGQGVMVDGQRIQVTSLGGTRFEARGGESDQDGFVSYRQVRAIEVLSTCRVAKIESNRAGQPLVASVDCAHPRIAISSTQRG